MILKGAMVAVMAAFTFVFTVTVLQSIEVAEASHCPSGTYAYTCRATKQWCSNRDRDPQPYECGCTCSTASCQDGNYLTYNSCAGSYCSSSSCPANRADVNNNPADACEINLLTNPSHCGSVNNVCSSGVCTNGVCDNFGVSVDPTSGIANRGDVKTVNVSISNLAGTPAPTLSASGLPASTTASFSPTSCTAPCYSNMSITTTGSTPTGSSSITVTGSYNSLQRTATYSLSVIANSCNNNFVCESPETQSSCSSDCNTTATMPSPVTPGQIVNISVEFYDFRYIANGKVRIDLSIDGTTTWNSANGCTIGGVKMGPSSGNGAVAWPSGTVSENGHFRISALCTIPSTISSGSHTLSATPTIF